MSKENRQSLERSDTAVAIFFSNNETLEKNNQQNTIMSHRIT